MFIYLLTKKTKHVVTNLELRFNFPIDSRLIKLIRDLKSSKPVEEGEGGDLDDPN